MSDQQTSADYLKSEPGMEPVVIEGLFRAPPARVFQAFTQKEDVRHWFIPKAGSLVSAEIDLKVGGKWCFVIDRTEEKQIQFEGEYLVIDPPYRLEFNWHHVQEFADGSREATDSSLVTITFAAVGDATEVRLYHSAIKSEDARRGVGGGWSSCFDRIASLLTN
ncbi:SRPBCC domain-containing protein [Labrenzia sp. CE80]|uniref:SRPBCC family protein n=1 Tax=Labrenzia sp. CE80 TaxID=1788986 RepID=UPI00129BA23D|nr:SRPBCC domain-containing protein [Labrenzia sp. CE80]